MPSTDPTPAAPPTTELRTYLGPADRPLYGAVHLPADRRVRGTVLLVAPLAKEQYDALRGLRRLADTLAADRLAVLRFDYPGTGDSALPAGRPGAVAEWTAAVRDAAAYLAGLGLGEPAVVALRAGALLAAAADLTPPAAVLWDPVRSGRPYVRAQRALSALAVGAGPGTWVGLDVHPDAAAALSALRADGPLAVRTLIAHRAGEPPDAVPDGTDLLAVEGMAAFLEPGAHLVAIPDRGVAGIADWLGAALPERAPRTVEPPIRTRARFGALEERIEQLDGAAAIRTVPLGTTPGPAVVLCATANDTRHGPNRAWVELAREVAARGGTALRFDRRGAGESGPVGAAETVELFPATGVDDVLAAATSCAGPVLAAGVCSGSWYAAHAARAGAADAAVLVNAVLYSWRLKRSVTAAPGADLGVPRSDPAFARSPRGRIKDLLRRRLPYPAWRALGRRGITQVPEVLLAPIAEAGADVTLVLAPDDAAWFTAQRGPEGARRIAAPLRTESVGAGDHPGHHPAVRAAVATAILDWCTQR